MRSSTSALTFWPGESAYPDPRELFRRLQHSSASARYPGRRGAPTANRSPPSFPTDARSPDNLRCGTELPISGTTRDSLFRSRPVAEKEPATELARLAREPSPHLPGAATA